MNTKKVDIAVVYNGVRQVLADEGIPCFTTQLTNRYVVETEWVGIRFGSAAAADPSRSPAPFDTRYPTYIKYFLDIDKKGYSISAITNSGGTQWTFYDQSYNSSIFVDVMPYTEYWDFVARLSRTINGGIKNRVDGGQYTNFLPGPGRPRSFFPDSTYPRQMSTGPSPETPRTRDSSPAEKTTEQKTIEISPSLLKGFAMADDYGKDITKPQNPGTVESYRQLAPSPHSEDTVALANRDAEDSPQQKEPSLPLDPGWHLLRGETVGEW